MEDYRDRHILVFGLARSGFAAVRLLLNAGAVVCGSDEDEKVEIEGTLNNILGYFDKLSEIDTKGVEPLTHILPVENVVRKDEVKPSLDQKTALGNAPKHDRGHFVIPKVIE